MLAQNPLDKLFNLYLFFCNARLPEPRFGVHAALPAAGRDSSHARISDSRQATARSPSRMGAGAAPALTQRNQVRSPTPTAAITWSILRCLIKSSWLGASSTLLLVPFLFMRRVHRRPPPKRWPPPETASDLRRGGARRKGPTPSRPELVSDLETLPFIPSLVH